MASMCFRCSFSEVTDTDLLKNRWFGSTSLGLIERESGVLPSDVFYTFAVYCVAQGRNTSGIQFFEQAGGTRDLARSHHPFQLFHRAVISFVRVFWTGEPWLRFDVCPSLLAYSP